MPSPLQNALYAAIARQSAPQQHQPYEKPMEVQAAFDPEFYRSSGNALKDALLRGGVGSLLGGGVDSQPGLRTVSGLLSGDMQAPPLSSEWYGNKMQQYGLVSADRNPVAENLAGLLSGPAAGKVAQMAPKVESALARAAMNLSAPRDLNTGAFMGQRGAVSVKSGYAPKSLEGAFSQERIDHPDLVYRTPMARAAQLASDTSASTSFKKTNDGNFVGSYLPVWGNGEKPFFALGDNLDETIAAFNKKLNSVASKAAAEKVYEPVPTHWRGDAKKIARELIDSGVQLGPSSFIDSARSESKYIMLPTGQKIRISNHDLPNVYESADYEFRGGSVKDFMKQLFGQEE